MVSQKRSLASLDPRFEDMHVHSTFSDGTSSVKDNLAEAVAVGLRRICCVDHVRVDTTWVPEFVEHVRREAVLVQDSGLDVRVGVEAKILDESGTLDLPAGLSPVDFVLAADHQFPVGDHFLSPSAVRRGLADRSLCPDRLIEGLIRATCGAVERYERVILAHLFSILAKVGLDEELVPAELLWDLAECTARRGALIEVSEKWSCPSPRTIQFFRAAGAGILASTDSHALHTIGRYSASSLRTLGLKEVSGAAA